MPVVQSDSLDIFHHLALESFWLEEPLSAPLLFLWQSEAVVLGKNQNPWKECRLARMEADGVVLARRVSGGGTVFHDRGNLNYALLLPRDMYDSEQAFEMVLSAIRACGLPAEKTGKSNLTVNGAKFSGNAFCFKKGRAPHHGTLLVESDLARLTRYLGASIGKMKTRAVESIPAKVMNLGIPMQQIKEALQESFARYYGESSMMEAPDAHPRVRELEQLYRSREWIWHSTPPFEVEVGSVRLRVEKGRIVEAEGEEAASLIGKEFSLALLKA